MAFIAQPACGELLYDPMCGVGTVPIEASYLDPMTICCGSDISPLAIQHFSNNAARAGLETKAFICDSIRSPVKSEAVDIIICDLPWGRRSQLYSMTTEQPSYKQVLAEYSRILKKGGRMVLLTEESDALIQTLADSPLKEKNRYLISLYGRQATLFCLVKTR